MTRYVLIDTKTGEIAGDSAKVAVSVGATPQEVAAAIDGETSPRRTYSMLGAKREDSPPGYEVWQVNADHDGDVTDANAQGKYLGFMEITEAPAA